MTRTRNEWLDSLDWHDGPPLVPGPPEDPIYGSLRTPPEPRLRIAPGMVYRLDNGLAVIVGDISGLGGTCECCGGKPTIGEVVAWAQLFGGPGT